MMLLELFSGSGVLSDTFKRHNWETVTIDFNPDYQADYHQNVYDLLTIKDIVCVCGDKMPNVIWCSPDCSTYSKLGIQFHRIKKGYTPIPISDYAKYCDENNRKMFNFITSLDLLWFFENPTALMRYMDFTERLPRYTTTYCQYGEQIRKETDIFTNHPNPDFKKPCKNGDPCHLPVGRFGKYGNGVQNGINSSFERAKLPKLFCEHIFKICDDYYKGD